MDALYVSRFYLTYCIVGNFSCFFCRLLIFFKIDFFKMLFQEHYKIIKRF